MGEPELPPEPDFPPPEEMPPEELIDGPETSPAPVTHLAGRTVPHDLRAEAAVLGAMIIDNQVISDVMGILIPDHFYLPAHRLLFEAIHELDRTGSAVDMVLLPGRRILLRGCGKDTMSVGAKRAAALVDGGLHHPNDTGTTGPGQQFTSKRGRQGTAACRGGGA